jgi:hypothetical protein
MELNEVLGYIQASKGVLDILRTLGGLLPTGPGADAAQQRLGQAEKALRAAEVQLAHSLGYRLCQCTFPPQIMLSKGYHHTHNLELFTCPTCGKQEPSAHTIRQYDDVKAHNEGLGPGWEDAGRI